MRQPGETVSRALGVNLQGVHALYSSKGGKYERELRVLGRSTAIQLLFSLVIKEITLCGVQLKSPFHLFNPTFLS